MRDATAWGRAIFVRRRQELVRQGLAQGDLEAARDAVRAIEPGDFEGGSVIAEACFRVLAFADSTDESVRAALKILGRLPIRFA